MTSRKPLTHKSKPRNRDIRTAKLGSARDAIGNLTPRAEIYILTFGQFSLIDAIVACLDQTGPAFVDISTWTAADAHLEKSAALIANAQILGMRFLVDRSFITRQPDYCAHMRRLFGDHCIRTLKTHAKFALIRNESWNLAIRTSMNLNENPRLENIEISDDPALAGFLGDIVHSVFREHDAGAFNEGLPGLEAIENVHRNGALAAPRITRHLNTPTLGRPQ